LSFVGSYAVVVGAAAAGAGLVPVGAAPGFGPVATLERPVFGEGPPVVGVVGGGVLGDPDAAAAEAALLAEASGLPESADADGALGAGSGAAEGSGGELADGGVADEVEPLATAVVSPGCPRVTITTVPAAAAAMRSPNARRPNVLPPPPAGSPASPATAGPMLPLWPGPGPDVRGAPRGAGATFPVSAARDLRTCSADIAPIGEANGTRASAS
jgi:hypothetical protein